VLVFQDETSYFFIGTTSKCLFLRPDEKHKRFTDGKVDVSKIAVYFGGGGHKRAAGCDLQGSMYDVINNITAEICKQIQECCD